MLDISTSPPHVIPNCVQALHALSHSEIMRYQKNEGLKSADFPKVCKRGDNNFQRTYKVSTAKVVTYSISTCIMKERL